jgi:hypothetical protein
MSTDEKLNVIRKYLRTVSPESEHADKYDFDRMAWTFRLYQKGKIQLVTFSREFIEDNAPGHISSFLEYEQVLKYFERESIKRVLVTGKGISTEK